MSDNRQFSKNVWGGVQRGRIKWIDSMRGIAILFVVLGHCAGRLDDPVNRAILSFHMPLFFFISGLSSQVGGRKQGSFIGFLKKRTRGIMIPQAVLFFINIVFILANRQQITLRLIFETWFNWFFSVLFICSLLDWFLRTSGIISKQYICLGMAIILMLFTQVMHIQTLIHIETVPMAMFFYLGGIYSFRELNQSIHIKLKHMWVLLPPLIIICSYWNAPVTMYSNEYGNLALFAISSMAGILVCYEMGRRLEDNKLLLWLGQCSVGIYIFHARVINAFHVIGHMILPSLENYLYPAYWHYFIIAILVLIPMVYVIEKYIPFLIGKKRGRFESYGKDE